MSVQFPSTFPAFASAHKALLVQSRDSLATRTFQAELIYNYSGSKHISKALRKFGIKETINYILVGRFDATAEELKATRALVTGTGINPSSPHTQVLQTHTSGVGSVMHPLKRLRHAELLPETFCDEIRCFFVY